MNIYYKVLIMAFLDGVAAAIVLLVFGREMDSQAGLNLNAVISVFSAFLGGAAVALGLVKRIQRSGSTSQNMYVSASAIGTAFIALAGLFAVRMIKPALGLDVFTALPHAAIAGLPFAVLFPYATLSSVQLAAATVMAGKEKRGFVLASAAAGAFAGAAVYLLFLWRYYTNIDVLYMAGIITLAATYIMFRDKTLEGRYTMLAVIIAAVIYLGFNVGGLKGRADRASSRAPYKGLTIVAEKEYPTVKFVMAKKEPVLYVFENGSLTYAIPDGKYGEMAKFAKGKKILIINGGAAGLIDALGAGYEVVSYEYDPYTAYIMEKLYGANVLPKSRVTFKSGLPSAGFTADTVFINPRRAGPPPYSIKNLEDIKRFCMNPGSGIVVMPAAEDMEKAKEDVKKVFNNASFENGFITAIKQGEKLTGDAMRKLGIK
jgi:hypothetical protein